MKLLLLALTLFGTTTAQFSAAAQAAIVNNHNALRSEIAQGSYVRGGAFMPSASNMIKMRWDKGLAANAQKWANACPNGHSGFPNVGENMYWSWTSGTVSSLDKYGVSASDSWSREFEDYGWSSRVLDQETWDSGVGHATQMVWAETGNIGCGVKNCGKDASKNNMVKIVVVCQYQDQGNWMGEEIYEKGETCSDCPYGTQCDASGDSGLCEFEFGN